MNFTNFFLILRIIQDFFSKFFSKHFFCSLAGLRSMIRIISESRNFDLTKPNLNNSFVTTIVAKSMDIFPFSIMGQFNGVGILCVSFIFIFWNYRISMFKIHNKIIFIILNFLKLINLSSLLSFLLKLNSNYKVYFFSLY